MSRIVIIHFTGPPSPGGIEHFLQAQVSVLVAQGHDVTFVVGAGDELPDAECFVVPALLPAQVRNTDCTVADIVRTLRPIISRCDQCWVHNAFTVNLNPELTAALCRLVEEMPRVAWVAWCEDISAISRFVNGAVVQHALPSPMTWVTISDTRSQELGQYLGIDLRSIWVVPPPVDAAQLLGLGNAGRLILSQAQVRAADPLVVVPAKLLPHKRLDLAIEVATALSAQGCDLMMLITGAQSAHEPGRSASLAEALRARVAHTGAHQHVRFLEDICVASDDAVRDCLALADVVFIPSAEEGFGLPLLESAGLRAPVVCRDIPVFRELAGDVATYFSPGDSPARIASMIRAARNTPANRLRRRALNSQRVFAEQIRTIVSALPASAR